MEKMIITIGREFGSGGREIGELLAKKLGIPYYDKALIKRVSDEGGLHESFIETHEETAPQFLGGNFDRNMVDNFYQMSISDQLFVNQSNTIKKIADEGPCVIVGRCADYILADYCDTLNVFISAGTDYKKSRKYAVAPEKADYTDAQMEKYIKDMDKRRRKYYEHYTGQKWGQVDNYDLCIRADLVGLEGAVDIIITCLNNIQK